MLKMSMKKFVSIFSLFFIGFLLIPKVNPYSLVCAQVLQPGCEFKVLMYDLQPANTASNLENNHLAFVNGMNTLGYDFTHGKRLTTPTITLNYLQQYDVVYFWNGCGGNTGLFSPAELTAIRDYYLSGGHLILTADDGNGDSTSLGNCYDRINQVSNNLGAYFTGYFSMPEFLCHNLYKPPTSDSALLTGISQSKFYSPAQLVFTGNVSWGGSLPQISAQYSDGNYGSTVFNAMGYIPKNASHGLVVFSAEREFLTGNQVNCAGQTGREFWNNLIGQNQVCVTPTATPTLTSTPTNTPVAPTSTTGPTSPPLMGTCNQIIVRYSATDNPNRPPQPSDQIQLECGAITGAARYEFRGRTASNQTFTFSPQPISAGARISTSLNLPVDSYLFQCRGCADQTAASCQPWQSE